MGSSASAVGRLGGEGPWVGFAPRPDGGHWLAIGFAGGELTLEADTDLLLCLAVAYFAEGLEEPPDDLAATHADVAGLVRRLAATERNPGRRAALESAVDGIDDGLGPDVVIARLTSAIAGPEAGDPVAHVRDRVANVAARS